jgi:hypothetical protein
MRSGAESFAGAKQRFDDEIAITAQLPTGKPSTAPSMR